MFRALLILLVVLFFLPANHLFGQARKSQDSQPWFSTFEDDITARLYLARKYTLLNLEGPAGIQSLKYKPNTPLSMGVTAGYKALSLSFGTAFGFLNKGRDAKGKTHSFDFQTHLYTRNWVTDIYGQFYKGYYLALGAPPGTRDKSFYIRPDIHVNLLGASVYRLLNGDRFSYRAGFLQNEWQHRSAGSILLGAEVYYGATKGDSALVPSKTASFFPQRGVKRVRLFEIGPGAGYAYTAVWNDHFFATGSLTINGNISFVKEEKDTSAMKTSFRPNTTLRFVAGYNSIAWAFTLSWLSNATNAEGASSNLNYTMKTGQFQFTIAHRFLPGRELKGKMDHIIHKLP